MQTASSPSTWSLARCTACDHVTACDRVWQGGGGEACAAAAGVAAEAMSHNLSRANLTTPFSRRVNGCKHSLLSCSAVYMNAGFVAFSLWQGIPRRGGKQQVFFTLPALQRVQSPMRCSLFTTEYWYYLVGGNKQLQPVAALKAVRRTGNRH